MEAAALTKYANRETYQSLRATKARRVGEFGTRMAWAVRTNTPLSAAPPCLTRFSHTSRGSWIHMKSAPTGVGGGPHARMPYESPAVGGEHRSPICCPCSQPPNRAGSWESVQDLSLLPLSHPAHQKWVGLLTLELSSCPGRDHWSCWRPSENAPDCEWHWNGSIRVRQ